MKTIRIKDEAHKKLAKIMGELTTRNGETKSFNDAIEELLKLWETSKKE